MESDTRNLEGLLELRALREEAAEGDLAVARGSAVEAERGLELRHRTLREHRALRAAREQCLFDELAASAGDPAALERYRYAMQALAHEDIRLRERIVEAERDLATAATALDAARGHYANAVRERDKLALLVRGCREEERLAAARRDEDEAEEWNITSGGHPSAFA